jgi:predicted phage terminase large subunit-like protein
MSINKQTLHSLLRTDFLSFIRKVFQTVSPGDIYTHNWHIEAIAWVLQQCALGHIKRLIITLPPRSLKSIIASVAFPAWILGHDPTRKIIAASYAQDLSIKHSLDCRSVMESDWYRNSFPKTRPDPSRNTQAEFLTTCKGFRLATSVGGTLTGRGGNLLILDDPHKADEAQSDSKREATIAWFTNTAISRLDNKKEDAIILIQQRLHEDDLAGRLLDAGGWVHLNLPAIAEDNEEIPIGDGRHHYRKAGEALQPEREPLEVLEAIKATMGSYNFAAQYQQRPAPAGGGIVKWEWFNEYDHLPDTVSGDLIVQSWDPACKAGAMNDWSVCTTWLCHAGRMYLLDVFRKRLEFPELYYSVKSLAAKWRADLVIIENANAGTALIQQLQRETRLNFRWIAPKGEKVTRMRTENIPIEAGRVLIPREAPWLADFRHEIVHFPNGKYDDQVDSLSQFLLWARVRDPAREAQVVPKIWDHPGAAGGSTVTLITSPPDLTVDDLFTMTLP